MPWVPSTTAIEGDLTVASGETLVVDEDLEVGGDVYVNGTLVIDGSTFQTYTGSWPDGVCNIFVYGTLRIVNGSMLTGDFRIVMGPSGSIEVRHSEVVCRSSQMYCIDHSPGSVRVVNSTISTNYGLLWCEGANVSLVNSGRTRTGTRGIFGLKDSPSHSPRPSPKLARRRARPRT